MGNARVKNLKGEQGGQYITDAQATPQPALPMEGGWTAGLCITEVTITAITQPAFINSNEILNKALPIGFVIYGTTTDITVTGTIQMFNADDPTRFPDMDNGGSL